jgi:hypothetical protein
LLLRKVSTIEEVTRPAAIKKVREEEGTPFDDLKFELLS